MKINVELNLNYINEDYSIDDAFKEELTSALYNKAVEVLAKNDLAQFVKDKEVSELKRMYENKLEELKLFSAGVEDKIKENVEKELIALLDAKAMKVTTWGQPVKEVTVKDIILEKMDLAFKDVEKLIVKAVNDKMSYRQYDIDKIIEIEAKKLKDENAKKVAEFILKGIK